MERIGALLLLLVLALPTHAAVEMYYLHNDHLGTPRVVTNQAQQVVWKGQLKPFGEMIVEIETITNHRRFPGQRLDIESRLHYNYFRDYDPRTGRYIQSDPIGLRGGLNTYSYVMVNPIRFIDPMGLATRAEIDLAVSMIRRANPWVYPNTPRSVEMIPGLSDWFGRPVQGATNFMGDIDLRAELYGDSCTPLSEFLGPEFLQTLAHEMYHSNQGIVEQIFSKPPNQLHRSIDNAAENLARKIAPEFDRRRSQF